VREAAAEAIQNTLVKFRWQIASTGGAGNAPFVYLRYTGPDSSPSGWAVRNGQIIPVNSGSLGTAVTGTVGTIAGSAWYDSQISVVTSGSNVTITEQTWNVTNHVTDAFGSGAALTNNTFPVQTAFASVASAVGLFAYQPGTLSVQQFGCYSDVAASALTITPGSGSGTSGSAISFTVGANGAQNGGAITLSDGGAGGTFSPASATVPSGVGQTASFSYTPAGAAGSHAITASSSALTGSAISGTASISVAAGPATALSLSPSSQAVVSGAASSTITCATNGTIATGPYTVTLTDGSAGGTFSPASLTLGGATTSGTFTYTSAAAASGVIALTAAIAGSSLANGSATITATPASALLTPASAAMVFSPFNWVTGLPNTSSSGGVASRTWNPGAYFRAYVTGCTTVVILFGSSNTAATFVYQVDDGLPSAPIACPSGAGYSITLPSSGAHSITWTLQTIPQATGRWAGTNAVTINGIQLGSGGSAAPATQGTRLLLIYGDSISEGFQSADGNTAVTTSFAYHVGQACYHLGGWEYGIRAASNSGLAWTTPAESGGQPAAWTSGNDGASAWNKVDGSGAAGAALTVGAAGSANELFMRQPSLIIEAWGTNDGLNSIASATVQATLVGLMQRLRVAAPNAVILKVVPFGGYVRGAIQAAAAQLADPKLVVFDRQSDALMTANGYCGNLVTGAAGSQSIHPWSLASAMLGVAVAAAAMQAYMPFATARPSGSAS